MHHLSFLWIRNALFVGFLGLYPVGCSLLFSDSDPEQTSTDAGSVDGDAGDRPPPRTTTIGGAGEVRIRDLSISDSRIYVVGQVSGLVMFDGESVDAGENLHAFWAAYDHEGVYIDHYIIPEGGSRAMAVATDGEDFLVVGSFFNEANFGDRIITGSGTDGFIARYGSDFVLTWVGTFGGAGFQRINELDISGNLLVFGGEFSGPSSILTDGVGTPNEAFPTPDLLDGFVASATANDGALLDEALLPAANNMGDGRVSAVVADGVYTAGIHLMDAGVVHKLNSTSVIWDVEASSTASATANTLATLASGTVCTAGRYTGTLAVEGGPTLTANNGDDTYVACLDPGDGTLRWLVPIAGSGTNVPTEMVGGDELTILGTFNLEISSGDLVADSRGGLDIFVAKIDDTGAPISLISFGGPGEATAGGVGLLPDGSTVVAGGFTGELFYREHSLATASGAADGFISILAPE